MKKALTLSISASHGEGFSERDLAELAAVLSEEVNIHFLIKQENTPDGITLLFIKND